MAGSMSYEPFLEKVEFSSPLRVPKTLIPHTGILSALGCTQWANMSFDPEFQTDI